MNVQKVNSNLSANKIASKGNTAEATTAPEQKKNGGKLLALGAAAAAAAGIAAIAIKKGKFKKAANGLTQLKDITFDKGIAKKGDDLFTGIIEHTTKSGKKYNIQYENGKLIKSTLKGTEEGVSDFSKVYQYGADGKISKIDFNEGLRKLSSTTFERGSHKINVAGNDVQTNVIKTTKEHFQFPLAGQKECTVSSLTKGPDGQCTTKTSFIGDEITDCIFDGVKQNDAIGTKIPPGYADKSITEIFDEI